MILRLASGSLTPARALEEALLRVDADHAHAQVLGEGTHHLVALIEAQQPVVDEHAHQLCADRTVQQGGDDR